MSRWVTFVLVANLLVIAGLAFAYPHLMIAPGRLMEVHKKLETDCFACHDGFFGTSPADCVACHKPADIGVRTSAGLPIARAKAKTPFHQKLASQDCVACHTDHAGAEKFGEIRSFSHGLLATDVRQQCGTCHSRPNDALHKRLSDQCGQCHVTEKWKPATFSHDRLAAAEREQCIACHKGKAPDDDLHRRSSAGCGACHGTQKWKPASFNHDKFFVFDDNHRRCKMCHRTENYKEYTCYSCHAHQSDQIRASHREEGMLDIENCAACHRSSNEDDAKRAWDAVRGKRR